MKKGYPMRLLRLHIYKNKPQLQQYTLSPNDNEEKITDFSNTNPMIHIIKFDPGCSSHCGACHKMFGERGRPTASGEKTRRGVMRRH